MDMSSNKDMDIGGCSNRGMGNNMVQDRVESLIVNNTFSPRDDIR
jgi:hypothetical protein